MDDVIARIWTDLIGRINGPMSFRIILQPVMAILFAFRDGLADARAGRPAYLWTIFHNEHDPIVRVAENSVPLADALAAAGITHQPVRPYSWYQGRWQRGLGHAFEPGSQDDKNSRADTEAWFKTYMPPTGDT